MGGSKKYVPVGTPSERVAKSHELTYLINPSTWRAAALGHPLVRENHPHAYKLPNHQLAALCIHYDIRVFGRRCPEYLAEPSCFSRNLDPHRPLTTP